MDLDELRSVQATERAQDSLQHLRDSFYDDVADYLRERIAARDRRAAKVDRPFADERVRQLTDEIETASDVLEALYERRVGKVVKLASFAAADMPVEEEGMTEHERELYDDLVERIKTNKATVLDAIVEGRPAGAADDASEESLDSMIPADNVTIGNPNVSADAIGSDTHVEEPATPERAESETAGPTESETTRPAESAKPEATEPAKPANTPADTSPETGSRSGGDTDRPSPTDLDAGTRRPDRDDDTEEGNGSVLADAMRAESDGGTTIDTPSETSVPSTGQGSPASSVDRTLVRITENLGEIFGVDQRTYPLNRGDVVSLPTVNAEPMIDRGAAERLR